MPKPVTTTEDLRSDFAAMDADRAAQSRWSLPTEARESRRRLSEAPGPGGDASSDSTSVFPGESSRSAADVSNVPRLDPTHTLLVWTDELNEEQSIALWVGLASARDEASRAEALRRWLSWSNALVPPGTLVEDLAASATDLLTELHALAQQPERVELYTDDDRRALTRALRAFVRVHENNPSVSLGAVQAVLRSSARGGIPPVPEAERAVLAGVLRRNIERVPAHEALPMFHALVGLDVKAPAFAPLTEAVLDFLLLDGETRTGFAPELADIAALPAWSSAVGLGLAGIGRSAMRAARLLSALSAHPDIARNLSRRTTETVRSYLLVALSHSRFGVWSRAARAMGRLAGALSGMPEELAKLLDPSTALTLRRRAHAALGNLGPDAPAELLGRRDELVSGAAEPWLLAALSLGLTDMVDVSDGMWGATVRAFAARGGPECWAMLLLSLKEIAIRRPREAQLVRELSAELRAMAEGHAAASPADADLIERALALAGRVLGPEGDGEVTPWALAHELGTRVAHDPGDRAIPVATEELIARTDNAMAVALRAISQENPRVAARANVVLEEVLDLIVDGDLVVIGERIGDGGSRAASLTYADALRKKLLRSVWTGLLRPTPATPTWRRWLLRTAGILPRVEPPGTYGDEAEKFVREQVFDTLERVADDPTLGNAALQRYVLGTLSELAEVVFPERAEGALLPVLVWLAVSRVALPSHARVRRTLERVPKETIDKLYLMMERLGQPGRATHDEVRELSQLAGDRTRLGKVLARLAEEMRGLEGRKPEAHWSGLPRFDLSELAAIGDEVKRVREDAHYALTTEPSREPAVTTESLTDRASRLNRSITSASLKFVDAARRAEIVEHYVGDLGALCEAVASACGPALGAPVRAQLARSLIAVRKRAAEVVREGASDVRYIARLKVLGTLASADEGGMTSTYLAEGPAPGKRVVVKLLPWERFAGANSETARRLFEREMQRLAPIVHPNVNSIVDAGFVEDGAYIALEHIPGASMETVLRKFGPFSMRRLGPVIADTARGLRCLHQRGIIHRDIKPGNILVQMELPDGGALTAESWDTSEFIRAVVIDLGIATDPQGERAETDQGIVGTPGYLAPEIARGLDLITPALDVFALAVVVFEALTGNNPYLEGDPELTTILVRHGTMPLPLELLPDEAQSQDLIDLLADATRFEPTERPTMGEFLARWIAAVSAIGAGPEISFE